MTDQRLQGLLSLLGAAHDRRAWHGPNLRSALRGVTAEQAAWRLAPERHNIWELAVHAAYWKYRVFLRLGEQPPRSFEEKGSDWFPRPADDGSSDWQADQGLLKTWHDRLLAAVEAFDPSRLDTQVGRSGHTYFGLISGVAMHDVYHAGQAQLLKRLYAGR